MVLTQKIVAKLNEIWCKIEWVLCEKFGAKLNIFGAKLDAVYGSQNESTWHAIRTTY